MMLMHIRGFSTAGMRRANNWDARFVIAIDNSGIVVHKSSQMSVQHYLNNRQIARCPRYLI